MSDNTRRRWFRFSLRTMFVVVTVLCCWLAWQLSIVRQRQTALKEVKEKGFHANLARDWAASLPAGFAGPPVATVPRVRAWFGDEAVQTFWYHSPVDRETELRLRRIFPEAEVHQVLPEPCHPGCFPRGTLVDTPQGVRPIDSLLPGDTVTAVRPNGETCDAKVQSVFVTDNVLLQVETEEGVLFTTQKQPLCLPGERMSPAGKLRPGDRVLRHHQGENYSVEVLEVSNTGRTEKVFNLILGDGDVFIAGGYLARCKPPATAQKARPAESW